MNKVNPIDRSYRSGDNNREESRRDNPRETVQKKGHASGPAVVNHIIPKDVRMKQLQLPFDELNIELKVFELYMYRDPRARYKTYGTHVEYTLAKNINQAEELFSTVYPNWWRTMGVKETTPGDVSTKLESLKEQVETCKFVLQALNISY